MSYIDFVSPIIQAYQAGLQMRHQQEQMMQQKEEFTRQQTEKERAAKVQEQQAQNILKQADEHFQVQQKMREAEFKFLKAKALPEITANMATGAIPSQAIQLGSQDQVTDLMRQGKWDEAKSIIDKSYGMTSPEINEMYGKQIIAPSLPEYINTQRQLMQPGIEAAVAKAKGESEATLPAKAYLAEVEGKQRMALAEQTAKSALERTKLTGEYGIQRAEIAGKYRVAATSLSKQMQVDPDEIAAAADLSSIGTAPLPAGKAGMATRLVLQKNGEVPFSPAERIKMNGVVSQANEVIDKMQAVLNNYGNEFGTAGGVTKSILPAKLTEMGTEIQRAKIMMLNLSGMLRGEKTSRFSDKDQERMEKLFFNPLQNKEKNMVYLEEVKGIVNKAINNMYSNLPATQREKIFRDPQSPMPDWLTAPQTKKVETKTEGGNTYRWDSNLGKLVKE